ncbi:MAG TPA: hypothetical protein VGR37_02045 [Longimicrobiaceae bacterium]|nr:hypothetical protein [Longimicrobiaceae bacterium]
MIKKLLAFAAVLGLLFLLNPSEPRHRERFAEGFRADHPVLSLFGADRVVPSLLSYRSYGVVSVGRVGERLATVGVLGMVHVRELELERLGEAAQAQGKGAVKGFLDGLGAEMRARQDGGAGK